MRGFVCGRGEGVVSRRGCAVFLKLAVDKCVDVHSCAIVCEVCVCRAKALAHHLRPAGLWLLGWSGTHVIVRVCFSGLATTQYPDCTLGWAPT